MEICYLGLKLSFVAVVTLCVLVAASLQKIIPVISGVPQGSVLGPTFAIIRACDFVIYPTDTQLYNNNINIVADILAIYLYLCRCFLVT